MPKKLPENIITFRKKLEELREQYETGPANDQARRIEAALSSLKGIRSSVASTLALVDDLIKGLTAEDSAADSASNQQASDEKSSLEHQAAIEDLKAEGIDPSIFLPFDATSKNSESSEQEELFPDEAKP